MQSNHVPAAMRPNVATLSEAGRRRRRLSVAVAAFAAAFAARDGRAATYYWDAVPDTTNTLDYGSGEFSSTAANWWTGTGYIGWTNAADVAQIGGGTYGGKTYPAGAGAPAQVLTFGENITLNQITQGGANASTQPVTFRSADGADHTLTLVGTNAGFGNNSNTSAFIVDVVVTGTVGVRQYNAGVVNYTRANTFTGGQLITNGVLRATDGVGLPSNNLLTITSGAFETSGTFTRPVGNTPGAVRLQGGDGGRGQQRLQRVRRAAHGEPWRARRRPQRSRGAFPTASRAPRPISTPTRSSSTPPPPTARSRSPTTSTCTRRRGSRTAA